MYMPRLKEFYINELHGTLMEQFNYASPLQVPRLQKIVLNIGVGEGVADTKKVDAAVGDLTLIAGQKPVISRAKKSIANFKLRQGSSVAGYIQLVVGIRL